MMEKQRGRIVQYRIEDIQYIRVQAIEEGELVAELEYTRVPKNDTIFEERFIGPGVCPYCGYPMNAGANECPNPECPKEILYIEEVDIMEYLNQIYEYKSYIVSINDRTYRFN